MDALRGLLRNGKWFTEPLPVIMDDFRQVRNPATHAERVERAIAAQWRDRLIRVSCAGDLVELA